MKPDLRVRRHSSLLFHDRLQLTLGVLHQAAIRVIDHHDLLRAQDVVRKQQRANGVVRDYATGVTNDVSVARLKAQGPFPKSSIHTCQYSEFPRWSWRDFIRIVFD